MLFIDKVIMLILLVLMIELLFLMACSSIFGGQFYYWQQVYQYDERSYA